MRLITFHPIYFQKQVYKGKERIHGLHHRARIRVLLHTQTGSSLLDTFSISCM